MLTDKLYPIFIDAVRIKPHEARLKKIKYLIKKMPPVHHDTLSYLMLHLALIAKNSSQNKVRFRKWHKSYATNSLQMEARNLALMFGPSIVRSSGEQMHTIVQHMSDQCKLVETMIKYRFGG